MTKATSGIASFFSIRTTPIPSSSGICQSSSARSGRSLSMMATASLPEAASPTTATSSNDRSSETRNERAGRSSSATTTRAVRSRRHLANIGICGLDRQRQLESRRRFPRPAPYESSDDAVGAVLTLEAPLHIAKTDAGTPTAFERLVRRPRAGILNDESQMAVSVASSLDPRAYGDIAATLFVARSRASPRFRRAAGAAAVEGECAAAASGRRS